jgi:aminopeptidase N
VWSRVLVACVTAVALTSGPSAAARLDPVLPGLGSTSYDVKHYDITLSWSPDGSIEATTTVTARARKRLPSYSLDLAGLHVTSVRVGGVDAPFARTGRKLVVTPAAPVPAGSTFLTRVEYDGHPVSLIDADGTLEGWLHTAGGSIALGEPRGSMTWFPNNDTPADKATFDVAVSVPAAYQAVSNGRNAAVVSDGLRSVWHWRVPEPMATYLATVAVGHYTRSTSTVDGVRYDSFVSEEGPASTRAIALLPHVVAGLSRWFGPYPFSDAGLIVDVSPGSYALEVQNRPFFPGRVGTRLLVHELAHQWFGDSVTPRAWNDIWLNEGFATYAGWLWTAKHGGRKTGQTYRAAYRSTSDWSPAPGAVTAATLFDSAVYVRGAMTLQALRERIGSRPFFKLLRTWTAEHRHANGTTAAFKRLAERISGRQLDRLFRDWLYVARKPGRDYVS